MSCKECKKKKRLEFLEESSKGMETKVIVGVVVAGIFALYGVFSFIKFLVTL